MANRRYGKARLVGGVRIERTFTSAMDARAWHRRMKEGWRRHFVTEVNIYSDKECTRSMLRGFDMLRFRLDCEDYGLPAAFDWANEGKYGWEGMPEMIKK